MSPETTSTAAPRVLAKAWPGTPPTRPLASPLRHRPPAVRAGRDDPEAHGFAHTKIQPPRPRAGLQLPRPALQQAMVQALGEHRLMLVCAPAGFGKTTALATLAATCGANRALAWLTLDEDDDLPRLLRCLIAALEPLDLPWRTTPEALVARADDAPGPAELAALSAEIVNTLAAGDAAAGLIVLDELHRVSDPAALTLLQLLAAQLPGPWTLALGSRQEPPWPLARLRASGELAEFRQAQLRFSAAETRALCALHGHDSAQAEALQARTGGWPAGLRLALHALAHAGPANRHGLIDRHVADFLAAEVLDALRPELRQFLLQASVLTTLDPARCATVCDHPQPARLLDELLRLDLFVTEVQPDEGQPGPALRLHEPLRQTLAWRLSQDHPQALPVLLQRAAQAEPDPRHRIGLLLQAGAHAAAAETLMQHAARWISEGSRDTVMQLAGQFPPAQQACAPAWLLVATLLAWARSDFPSMARHAQAAEAAAEHEGRPSLGQMALAYQAIALNAMGRAGDSARLQNALRRGPLADDTHLLELAAEQTTPLQAGAAQALPRLAGQPALAAMDPAAATAWRRWADSPGSTLGQASTVTPPSAEAKPRATGTAPQQAGLSARELEVLQRIATGDSNKQIARRFALSPHTVKRHVAHVLGKLGVASRGQAAAWWRQHGNPDAAPATRH